MRGRPRIGRPMKRRIHPKVLDIAVKERIKNNKDFMQMWAKLNERDPEAAKQMALKEYDKEKRKLLAEKNKETGKAIKTIKLADETGNNGSKVVIEEEYRFIPKTEGKILDKMSRDELLFRGLIPCAKQIGRSVTDGKTGFKANKERREKGRHGWMLLELALFGYANYLRLDEGKELVRLMIADDLIRDCGDKEAESRFEKAAIALMKNDVNQICRLDENGVIEAKSRQVRKRMLKCGLAVKEVVSNGLRCNSNIRDIRELNDDEIAILDKAMGPVKAKKSLCNRLRDPFYAYGELLEGCGFVGAKAAMYGLYIYMEMNSLENIVQLMYIDRFYAKGVDRLFRHATDLHEVYMQNGDETGEELGELEMDFAANIERMFNHLIDRTTRLREAGKEVLKGERGTVKGGP